VNATTPQPPQPHEIKLRVDPASAREITDEQALSC